VLGPVICSHGMYALRDSVLHEHTVPLDDYKGTDLDIGLPSNCKRC
jgi:hypothetical protein